jgi:hypothetical protein
MEPEAPGLDSSRIGSAHSDTKNYKKNIYFYSELAASLHDEGKGVQNFKQYKYTKNSDKDVKEILLIF